MRLDWNGITTRIKPQTADAKKWKLKDNFGDWWKDNQITKYKSPLR